MRRVLMAGAVSATLVAGATPAVAGASAPETGAKAFSDCPQNRLCLWDNREGGGLRLAALTPPNDWRLTSASVNRANSVWNRTAYTAYLRDDNCKVHLQIDAGGRAPDLGAIDRIGCSGNWNNKIDAGLFGP